MRQTSLTPLRDETLKGRFASGVREPHLQREMRRLEMDQPGMSFWEFRDRGVSWLGKEVPKKMASQDVISTVAGTGDGNAATLKVLEAQQQRLQGMQDLTKQQQ